MESAVRYFATYDTCIVGYCCSFTCRSSLQLSPNATPLCSCHVGMPSGNNVHTVVAPTDVGAAKGSESLLCSTRGVGCMVHMLPGCLPAVPCSRQKLWVNQKPCRTLAALPAVWLRLTSHLGCLWKCTANTDPEVAAGSAF